MFVCFVFVLLMKKSIDTDILRYSMVYNITIHTKVLMPEE